MVDKEPEIIKCGKLTKRFLTDLKEGLFFSSNAFVSKFKPAIAEEVVLPSLRMEQWMRIVDAGADQRMCYVFKTKQDHEKWMANAYASINKNKSKKVN